MPDHLSIDECKAIQSKFGLHDVHVVSIGDNGLAVAHTNKERAELADLTCCELYCWLLDLDEPPHPGGVYVVIEHEPDLYSESYGSDPWDFYTLQRWFGWDMGEDGED